MYYSRWSRSAWSKHAQQASAACAVLRALADANRQGGKDAGLAS